MTLPRYSLSRQHVDDPASWEPANSYDYEFDSHAIGGTSTLPPGWLWVNQGTATYNEQYGAGVINLLAQGSTYDWKMLVQPVTGSTWTATCKLFGAGYTTSYPAVMILRDSSTGKFLQFMMYTDSNNTFYLSDWTNPTTYSGVRVQTSNIYGGVSGVLRYLRVKKNSSTSYDFSVSPDGRCWVQLATANNPTAFLAIDQIGFGSSAFTSPISVGCEWFRVR